MGPARGRCSARVSFAAGTIALFVVAVAFGGGFGRIGAHPVWWHHVAGGLIGAAVVGVTTVAVRTLGTRAMIACRLAMAAIIDQFGLLGVDQQPLTLARSIGLVLLAAGVALVISGA